MSTRWTHRPGRRNGSSRPRMQSSLAPVSDGVVYVGSYDTYIYALDAQTGQEKWKFKTLGFPVTSSPAISDGVVYFSSDDTYLHALDAQIGREEMEASTPPLMSTLPRPSRVGWSLRHQWELCAPYAVDIQSGQQQWRFEGAGAGPQPCRPGWSTPGVVTFTCTPSTSKTDRRNGSSPGSGASWGLGPPRPSRVR